MDVDEILCCFVAAESWQSHPIARAIVALAHSLDLKVVAEGVETNTQAKVLQSLSCDALQGFLFSKPIPDSNLLAFARQWQRQRQAASSRAATS